VLKAEGYITEIDSKKMQAKVHFPGHDDVESDWLQIGFIGPDSYFNYRKDDYVGCMMDSNLEDGWIVCRLYSENVEFSETGEKLFVKEFRDGTKIQYDEEAGKLTIEVKGDIELETGQKVMLKAFGVDIGGIGPLQGAVHAMSLCPIFSVCHPGSTTVKTTM